MKLTEIKYSWSERAFILSLVLTIIVATTWLITSTVDFLRKLLHG